MVYKSILVAGEEEQPREVLPAGVRQAHHRPEDLRLE